MTDVDSQLRNVVFVVFSDDWGRHPSSCQHLFRRIVPRADVVWVNTVGLRTPRFSLYDLRRAAQVLRGWFRQGPGTHTDATSTTGEPAPTVLRPMMWPSFRREWAATFNQWLLERAVSAALHNVAPPKRAVLVSTLPVVPNLFRNGRFARKVYYCVDDFTEWHGVDGEAMRRLEARTLAACDELIATSTPILEARAGQVPKSVLLTHGVDLQHFSSARPDASSPIASLPKPVIGMFGVFDQRVDGQALRAAARALPQASFAVIGPVVDWPAEAFRDVPNLHFVGSKPYAELPAHVAHFDLCILPYVVDQTTVNLNPLKLKEYLATGKPVIATRLPEAVKLAPYLTLADNDTFAETVKTAVAGLSRVTSPPSGLEAFLERETWEAKSKFFLTEVLSGL